MFGRKSKKKTAKPAKPAKAAKPSHAKSRSVKASSTKRAKDDDETVVVELPETVAHEPEAVVADAQPHARPGVGRRRWHNMSSSSAGV